MAGKLAGMPDPALSWQDVKPDYIGRRTDLLSFMNDLTKGGA
jgi:hypothetical protein